MGSDGKGGSGGCFRAFGLAWVAAVGLLWGQAAAATTIWTFAAPATSVSSQSPPYPIVATLTLTQTVDGVQFVLDPNESSPGFLADPDNAFVERIDYVYAGPALTAASFRNDDGAIAGFAFESNSNMDSSYMADDYHIAVDFPSKNAAGRFDPGQTRTWTVLGSTLAQFTGTLATANSKPTPTSGILSVSSYSLPDENPTPANWVTVVPEPGSAALLALGLLGLSGRARRRSA